MAMAKKKKTKTSSPNPDNSSTIQCLLDLEKALSMSPNNNAPTILAAIKTIKTNITTEDIEHADNIFNAHKYGDGHLTFSKITRFRENQIIKDLSGNAWKLLSYGIQVMSEDNCFLVNQKDLACTLGMAKQTIINAITCLEEYGCITKICTLKRKKPSGTVYMIRTDIARIGANSNDGFFRDKLSGDQNINYSDNSKPTYDVIHARVPYNNGTISFNYTDIIEKD